MGENEENENFDKIKVFSSEDDKLKVLGELLSNKSSRDIIRLLTEKEMYTNEIAKKLDMRSNLVIHHLKKLEELGLLEIDNKKITKKGNDHKYYRMVPNLLVSISQTNYEIKENGFLKRIFKKRIKYFVLGFFVILGGIATNNQLQNKGFEFTEEISKNNDLLPLVIMLSILSIGLISINLLEHFKKEKRVSNPNSIRRNEL